MLVKEIMTSAVRTARPDDMVKDIASVMCLNRISGLPVVDDHGLIIGVISEKDILYGMFPDLQEYMESPVSVDFIALEHQYKDVLHMKVSEIMSKKVTTVDPDMPVLKAASIMFRRRIRRIPVSRDDKLLGIVSMGDVHKAIFQANIAH